MDFTLLYCAKIASKNPAHIRRVIVAAALGACFAVLFPLFNPNAVISAAIKIISGLAICFIGGKFKNFKAYVKMSAVFLGFTFVLGGALVAVFSLVGSSYAEGNGYLLTSAPVGIPLFGALLLVIAARKIANKLRKVGKTTADCKIYLDGKCVAVSGFFDSGNKVYYRGQPVSVIPVRAAEKIVDESRIKEVVKIHTVAGSKKLKVFTADKMEISVDGKCSTVHGVKIGISAIAAGEAVLHTDLMED